MFVSSNGQPIRSFQFEFGRFVPYWVAVVMRIVLFFSYEFETAVTRVYQAKVLKLRTFFNTVNEVSQLGLSMNIPPERLLTAFAFYVAFPGRIGFGDICVDLG